MPLSPNIETTDNQAMPIYKAVGLLSLSLFLIACSDGGGAMPTAPTPTDPPRNGGLVSTFLRVDFDAAPLGEYSTAAFHAE